MAQQITFNLSHVFGGESSDVDNAYALRALLDCLISLNEAYLRHHPTVPGLYRSGVVYGRTTWWEPIPALYKRGYGDCKSLTAALCAELHVRHRIPAEPVFRFMPRYGGRDYHILIQTPQKFLDPSKDLGMGKDENRWFAHR